MITLLCILFLNWNNGFMYEYFTFLFSVFLQTFSKNITWYEKKVIKIELTFFSISFSVLELYYGCIFSQNIRVIKTHLNFTIHSNPSLRRRPAWIIKRNIRSKVIFLFSFFSFFHIFYFVKVHCLEKKEEPLSRRPLFLREASRPLETTWVVEAVDEKSEGEGED